MTDYIKKWENIGDFDELIKALDKIPNYPVSDKPNLATDLKNSEYIKEKIKGSDKYLQHLYAALCNNQFVKNDVYPLLTDDYWSCSWRSAGGIAAELAVNNTYDYLDYYCSGMFGKENIQEGTITDEIREDLFKIGWLVVK